MNDPSTATHAPVSDVPAPVSDVPAPGDRWLGSDGTLYDVVRPDEVGDRPRWWVTSSMLLGYGWGPSNPLQLHHIPTASCDLFALVVHITCLDLDAFVAGELEDPILARVFREHLPDCKRCQAVLEGRMQEVRITARPTREANLDGSLHVEDDCCRSSERCRRCGGRQHTQGTTYYGGLITVCEGCSCDEDLWKPRGYYRTSEPHGPGITGDDVEPPCGDLADFVELPVPRAAAFLDHLVWCSACRGALCGRVATEIAVAVGFEAT